MPREPGLPTVIRRLDAMSVQLDRILAKADRVAGRPPPAPITMALVVPATEFS